MGLIAIPSRYESAKQEQGKTIFFNSHILSDVEMICDRIAILAEGELICMGSLDQLLGKANRYQVRGKGGNIDILNRWIEDLAFEEDVWHSNSSDNIQV